MLCKTCGTELPAGTKFCTNCGTKQEAVPGEEKHKTLFISIIIFLSLAAVGLGITAFVFYEKTEHLRNVRNFLWHKVLDIHDLIEAVEKGDYSSTIYAVHKEICNEENISDLAFPIIPFSVVPWKHPLDRAAVITKIYYIDKNSYWNYTDPLQADKIAYLGFDFSLTGNIEIGDSLLIKIIQTSTGKRVGEKPLTKIVEKTREYSTGWGRDSGDVYERGWYLIQILHTAEVIGQQYVYIQ